MILVSLATATRLGYRILQTINAHSLGCYGIIKAKQVPQVVGNLKRIHVRFVVDQLLANRIDFCAFNGHTEETLSVHLASAWVRVVACIFYWNFV